MQTFIQESLRNTSQGKEAERILRACVHCGFCNANCPTYQVMGDELDGPRGRIYLIKSVLEGNVVTENTMEHLDCCLTCRACESICPSRVEYGKLLDIGREQIEKKIKRSWRQRLYRTLILQVLPYRIRFRFLLRLVQRIRCFLPPVLKGMIPVYKKKKISKLDVEGIPNVILLAGCVQSSLAPEINISVEKILHYFGVKACEVRNEQCCGALSHHLGERTQSLQLMRKNIDTIWPLINENNIEAIISTASGCGVHVKEYGYLLREDIQYRDKARKISTLTKDVSEYMSNFELEKIVAQKEITVRIAFQSPCTLQHGQKLEGVVEKILSRLSYKLDPINDSHLCCGSAGVYSLLKGNIANQLRRKKLDNLLGNQPDVILTSNIGCREYLQQQSPVPVRHWVEELAALLNE